MAFGEGFKQFREVNRGDVPMEVNSKRMTDDRFVDRSRLQERYSEEYVPSKVPGKFGTYISKTEKASLTDNARRGADALKHRSSFKNEPCDEMNNGCCPSPYFDGGPLTKRRGDE
jgi:hypothetical protein